jgi:uncharacterized membrane protein YeaQ/YmgE (transglycosylase-associated protein family)
MSILWTIIIGFIAGVIAKFIMAGNNEPSGFILTTIHPGREGSVASGIRDVDATLEMKVEQPKAISAVICRGSAGEIG